MNAPIFSSENGKKLWSDVTVEFELSRHELVLLEAACRTLDEVSILEAELIGAPRISKGSMGQDVANPLLSELRQQRSAFASLMKQLALPDEASANSTAARSASARAAANKRWGVGS